MKKTMASLVTALMATAAFAADAAKAETPGHKAPRLKRSTWPSRTAS
jgi:hypothetical protein